MDTVSLIQAFRDGSPAARKEALAAWVDELNPVEWRLLKQLLNARTFQFDIVGSLPMEIVAQIFSHLDIGEPYRLQRVSRRWHHILRSPDLVKPYLREWYGQSAWSSSSLLQDYALCAQKAEQIYRLRRGRFYSKMHDTRQFFPAQSVLANDTLAWTSDEESRTMSVCNLRTGKTWHAHTPGREVIRQIAASEHLIAYATYKMCFVKSLDGTQINQFRVPSPLVGSVACRGQYVVCGSGDFNPHREDAASIYIWDFNSGKGHSFEVDKCPGFTSHALPLHSPIAILPDPNSQTVVVFSYRWSMRGKGTRNEVDENRFPKGRPCSLNTYAHNYTIYFSRFTFSGELIQMGEAMFPGLVITAFRGLHPISSQGHWALKAVAEEEPSMEGSVPYVINLKFDENSHTLLFRPSPPHTAANHHPLRPGFASWNGAYYQVAIYESWHLFSTLCLGTEETQWFRSLLDPSITISERDDFTPVGEPAEPANTLWPDHVGSARLHTNETYLVSIGDDGHDVEVVIFAFENGLEIPEGVHDMLRDRT